MNNKKKLVYISISIIVMLVISTVGYKYLSKNYIEETEKISNNEKGSNSNINEDNIKNNVEENIDKDLQLNTEKNSELKKAPDFTVYDVDGNEVKLSQYKGKKPVVINFWASWCPPCKEEMPYFKEANDKYSKDDVEILMVNLTDGMRETKQKAIDYMKQKNYNMKLVFDLESDAAIKYQLDVIPRTLFIDINGNIVKDNVGAISKGTLEKNIEKIIGK